MHVYVVILTIEIIASHTFAHFVPLYHGVPRIVSIAPTLAILCSDGFGRTAIGAMTLNRL